MAKELVATLGGWMRTAASVALGERDRFVSVAGYGASVTITLPDPATVLPGKDFIVKDDAGDATTYPITVVAAVGTIDGEASAVIQVDWGAATFVSDGVSNYSIV